MYSLNCKRATMTVKYFGNRIGLYTNLHIDVDLWNSKGQKETGDNLWQRYRSWHKVLLERKKNERIKEIRPYV